MTAKHIWDEGIGSEIAFWNRWFETGGLEWPDEYRRRLDKERPLGKEVRRYLKDCYRDDENIPDTLDILDIGAGPLTALGKKWEGKQIRITATDALADEYDKIMALHGVVPPVRTTWCHAELLTERFPRSRFDLVWASNCLDHSYDPLQAINAAVDVVKVGCLVALTHSENEAEKELYRGLHQWNFCERRGAFHIWNRETDVNVNELLSPYASVECQMNESEVVVIIRKLRERDGLRAELRRAARGRLNAWRDRWPVLGRVLPMARK